MRLFESQSLPVPLDDAWAALNDVAVLRRVLPHCESLVETTRDEFVAEMAVPLGLATSRFTVHVHRREIEAPRRCTLHFETRTTGPGGSGSAALRLEPDGAAAATLHAEIAVALDGVIGVLGGPLIDLAAHEMARQFLEGLRTLVLERRARTRMP
jgi:carbon monoxide dehydrogenase subunit G